ncbi:hypothetical protein R5R35_002699 [Gryllus longicercus]|uniref:HAT C-terminal dimerisation domain-containing protein n=1 Tax=Gryllus longicercus TaxID=2509291 RepID=A0AAN9ZFN4_9ORTH
MMLPNECRRMLSEVEKILILILTVPATSTSCEKSFSALRRILTYLRGNMTQKRLTNLLILHVHQELTRQIALDEVLEEFISRTQERKKEYGFKI